MSTKLGQRRGDAERFSDDACVVLREACRDLGYLRGRGYSDTAGLKLVGDRYQLDGRQRKAVRGAACGGVQVRERGGRCVGVEGWRGRVLAVDAYNLLIVLGSARAGGVVVRGMDGCLRDLAGMHGSWTGGEEAREVAQAVGEVLEACGVEGVVWYIDAPVSKSGQLGQFLEDVGRGWGWEGRVVMDPDRDLIQETSRLVVSSDAYVLDHCAGWCNVAWEVVRRRCWGASVIDLCVLEE